MSTESTNSTALPEAAALTSALQGVESAVSSLYDALTILHEQSVTEWVRTTAGIAALLNEDVVCYALFMADIVEKFEDEDNNG